MGKMIDFMDENPQPKDFYHYDILKDKYGSIVFDFGRYLGHYEYARSYSTGIQITKSAREVVKKICITMKWKAFYSSWSPLIGFVFSLTAIVISIIALVKKP